MQVDDMDLVREFAASNSERAFATLVERHVNLVYSAALRRLNNVHEAEEVTQTVFIILAKKAGRLSPQTILSGWLYQTAQLMSANCARARRRRQQREQEAYMQFLQESGCDQSWQRLGPLLEEAMTRLDRHERDAIVVRFFENRTVREAAAALGLGEAAAQKRINRATEKLRNHFARRGVQVSAGALVASIGANSVHAAPAALAKSATALAVAHGGTAGSSTLTLLKTTLKLMAWTKMKTAVVTGVAALLVTGTTVVVIQHQIGKLPAPRPAQPGQTEFPKNAWHFAGYGDPESALETCMWAFGNGDSRTLLAGMTSAMQKKFEGKTVLTEKDRADADNIKAYRILDKQTLSDTEVMFNIETDGEGQGTDGTHASKMYLQRVGKEWRFDNAPKE